MEEERIRCIWPQLLKNPQELINLGGMRSRAEALDRKRKCIAFGSPDSLVHEWAQVGERFIEAIDDELYTPPDRTRIRPH